MYGLGQFIPLQAKLYTHYINHDINSIERYTQELYSQGVPLHRVKVCHCTGASTR